METLKKYSEKSSAWDFLDNDAKHCLVVKIVNLSLNNQEKFKNYNEYIKFLKQFNFKPVNKFGDFYEK